MHEVASRIGTTDRLPEQLYGNNTLLLCHEASGLTISFNAVDALRSWHEDNLPPLEVRHAQHWQRSRQKGPEVSNLVTFKYDW